LAASSNGLISWYDVDTGGTILGTGSSFLTPILSATQTYYVVAGDRCPGLPVAVTANVYPAPFVDLGPDTILIQSGQSVTLDPGSGYANYQWSTGDSTQTIYVSSSGSYVITVVDSNGCFASDVVIINVDVNTFELEDGSVFVIYPNPAHEVLNFSYETGNTSNKLYAQIISVDGRVLLFESILADHGIYRESITLDEYAPGVYFLRILNDNTALTRRFIVE